MPEPGEPFNPFGIFVGSFIPNAILRLTDMIPSAKLVWARLSQYAGRDGRAYPKQETLAKEVGIETRQVQRILRGLVRRKFLRVIPARGHARLRHQPNEYQFLWHKSFDEDLINDNGWTEPDPDNMSGPDRSSRTGPIQDNPKTSIRRRAKRRRNMVAAKKSRWRRFAEELHNAIRSVRAIDYSDHLNGWAKQFELLHTRNKVSTKRIRTILQWYCEQLPKGDQYLPVAHSGSAFRTKFDRIEMKMERDAFDQGKQGRGSPGRSSGLSKALGRHPKTSKPYLRWVSLAKDTAADVRAEGLDVDKADLTAVLCEVARVIAKINKKLKPDTAENLFQSTGLHICHSYARWLKNDIAGWPNWTGNLDGFLPGGKHWWRFIAAQQKAMQWKLTRKEMEVVREATQS